MFEQNFMGEFPFRPLLCPERRERADIAHQGCCQQIVLDAVGLSADMHPAQSWLPVRVLQYVPPRMTCGLRLKTARFLPQHYGCAEGRWGDVVPPQLLEKLGEKSSQRFAHTVTETDLNPGVLLRASTVLGINTFASG